MWGPARWARVGRRVKRVGVGVGSPSTFWSLWPSCSLQTSESGGRTAVRARRRRWTAVRARRRWRPVAYGPCGCCAFAHICAVCGPLGHCVCACGRFARGTGPLSTCLRPFWMGRCKFFGAACTRSGAVYPQACARRAELHGEGGRIARGVLRAANRGGSGVYFLPTDPAGAVGSSRAGAQVDFSCIPLAFSCEKGVTGGCQRRGCRRLSGAVGLSAGLGRGGPNRLWTSCQLSPKRRRLSCSERKGARGD